MIPIIETILLTGFACGLLYELIIYVHKLNERLTVIMKDYETAQRAGLNKKPNGVRK